jgi:exopolysaccharide biosynthesis protein
MKLVRRLALVLLLVVIALVASHGPPSALHGKRDLGAGVTVEREGSICVVKVPRRSGIRLRAVLADREKNKLLSLKEIAGKAFAAVNGDYHFLEGPNFARTYSVLVTDGEVVWVGSKSEAEESFWLDEEHVPHMSVPGPKPWLAIGTGPRLLANGEVTERVRNEKTQPGWVSSVARTAVGFDEKTIFLVVTPQEPGAGLAMLGLAEAMKKLGCKEALNLDGGPSSALVVRGDLVNVPPGEERLVNPVASALLVLEPDGSTGVQ